MEIENIYKIFINSKGLSTDTRTIIKGQIFLSLSGDRFDGHDFINEAINKGADFVIVHDIDKIKDIDKNKLIIVKNTKETLIELAKIHRLNFNIPVLVVGGSNGKTTTKNLLNNIFEKKYKVLASPKNFNNDLGVCFTLLQIKKNHDMVILEIGTNHKGEIKELLNISKPTYGVLTNIGKEHLEGLQSVKGVEKEEGEIFKYLSKNRGFIFINNELPKKIKQVGIKTEHLIFNFNKIKIINLFPIKFSLKIKNKKYDFTSNFFGKFNIKNIVSSIYIGQHFNIPLSKIIRAIKELKPDYLRGEVLKFKNTKVLLDCYNSNPSSTESFIDFIKTIKNKKLYLVVGGMLELGKYSISEHKKIFNKIIKIKSSKVFFVGNEFRFIKSKIEKSNNLFFETTEEAKVYINKINFTDNNLILVKGSRGYTLEKIFGK